jgi:guanylate kinase
LRIFVSGPSGVGKSTIIKQVLARHADIRLSISFTTRQPRPGEQDGREYFFVARPTFEDMVRSKRFLEWAAVHDHLYGTSLDWVTNTEASGCSILFDIDVQGVRQAQANGSPGAYIMLLPPDIEALGKRLKGRGTEDTLALKTRLENAEQEMRAWNIYDYLVVNESIEQAVSDVETIIAAHRLSTPEAIRRLAWLTAIG